jgi:hypothetical protein
MSEASAGNRVEYRWHSSCASDHNDAGARGEIGGSCVANDTPAAAQVQQVLVLNGTSLADGAAHHE